MPKLEQFVIVETRRASPLRAEGCGTTRWHVVQRDHEEMWGLPHHRLIPPNHTLICTTPAASAAGSSSEVAAYLTRLSRMLCGADALSQSHELACNASRRANRQAWLPARASRRKQKQFLFSG